MPRLGSININRWADGDDDEQKKKSANKKTNRKTQGNKKGSSSAILDSPDAWATGSFLGDIAAFGGKIKEKVQQASHDDPLIGSHPGSKESNESEGVQQWQTPSDRPRPQQGNSTKGFVDQVKAGKTVTNQDLENRYGGSGQYDIEASGDKFFMRSQDAARPYARSKVGDREYFLPADQQQQQTSEFRGPPGTDIDPGWSVEDKIRKADQLMRRGQMSEEGFRAFTEAVGGKELIKQESDAQRQMIKDFGLTPSGYKQGGSQKAASGELRGEDIFKEVIKNTPEMMEQWRMERPEGFEDMEPARQAQLQQSFLQKFYPPAIAQFLYGLTGQDQGGENPDNFIK